MGILDDFESAVERGMKGTFNRIFRSELKPVDINSQVRAAMDTHLHEYGRDYSVAPNVYTVRMAPSDLRRLDDYDPQIIKEEVARSAQEYAEENGYALLGPISVEFETGNDELTGQLEIAAQIRRGKAAPATGQAASDHYPIIDVNGEKWLLTEDVTVLGRGSDADITIDDSSVSRRHLELRKTPHGVIASDLGSTNGLYVEGNHVDAATLINGNQLMIGRTTIWFWSGDEEETG